MVATTVPPRSRAPCWPCPATAPTRPRRDDALGRAARDRTEAQIVAVTGSVGKTGTKEAWHVLSAQGATHASAASYNNHWACR